MNRPTLSRLAHAVLLLAAAGTLSACGSYAGTADDGGGSTGGGSTGGGGPGPTATSCDALFTQRVQPRLEFCRNCHIKDGIADKADGDKFLLTANKADDAVKLKEAWEALGKNDDGASRILKMSSGTDTHSHSGGKPWPVTSNAYKDMDAYLKGYDDPAACTGGTTGADADWPLLGGPRGGNFASRFCEGKGDDAVLPVDPRTLVVDGVNKDKAVAFNAFWRDCSNGQPGVHANNVHERPATCGEFRAQSAQGRFIGEGQGEVGTPMAFGGGQTPDEQSGLDAAKYNRLWEVWGMSQRPLDFDELVAERYGSPLTPANVHNPYPLPGEDPNAPGVNGGSGRLPLIFTQLRNADGTWKGQIGTKVCLQCHNGQIGTEADGPGMGPQLAGAGSIGDFTVAGHELDKAANLQAEGQDDPVTQVAENYLVMPSPTSAITISTNRGTGAIDFFQLAYVLFSNGDPALLANDKIVFSQAIGNIKSPPWWNLGYRTQKFHGAVLPTDSSRIDMAAYYNLTKGMQDGLAANFGQPPSGGKKAIDWVDDNAGEFQTWAEAQSSPHMPIGFCPSANGKPCIDKAKAERGAILFHTKDLWGNTTDDSKPDYQTIARPAEGNGSCASCHGAYSPHFTHDPAVLDSPDLAGIAAYTVPLSIIGTDPVYADAMQSIRNADGSTPDSVSNQDVVYCGAANAQTSGYRDPDLAPGVPGQYHKVSIMLAPPLWGIWASAPYFHNGSVPNIEAVLNPDGADRPALWRRVSTPTPPLVLTGLDEADQAKIVMGYDTDLWRAYDFDKLGWKYDAVTCEESTTQAGLTCDPVEGVPNPIQILLNQLYTYAGATWNLPRYEGMNGTQQDTENRKVFNTNLYSQGNQGHEFTRVLTKAEREAILEYLKTL